MPVERGYVLVRRGPAQAEQLCRLLLALADVAFASPGVATSFSVTSGANAFAQVFIDDIVISPLPGFGVPGTGSVIGTLNLDAHGTVGASAEASGPFSASSSANVEFETVIAGTSFTGQLFTFMDSLSTSPSVFATDLFDGFGGDAAFALTVAGLPIDVPFSVSMSMRLGGGGGIFGGPSGAGSAASGGTALFGNTVSFASIGPVFTLPAGYTVNSAGGGIVNNAWIGASSVAVPEPPALLLSASGLVAMLSLCRLYASRCRRHSALV